MERHHSTRICHDIDDDAFEHPVPDPRVLRNDLPPSLVEILKKALAKDRNQRYQSTTELANDLKKVSLTTVNEVPLDAAVTVLPSTKKELDNRSSVAQVPLDSATLYEPRPVVRPVINPTPAAGNIAPGQNYSHVIEQPEALGPFEKKKPSKLLFLGIGAIVLVFLAVLLIWGISLISRQTEKQTAQNTDVPTQAEVVAIVGTNTPVVQPTATVDLNANFNATFNSSGFSPLTGHRHCNSNSYPATDRNSDRHDATFVCTDQWCQYQRQSILCSRL